VIRFISVLFVLKFKSKTSRYLWCNFGNRPLFVNLVFLVQFVSFVISGRLKNKTLFNGITTILLLQIYFNSFSKHFFGIFLMLTCANHFLLV